MNYGFAIDNGACIGCHACSTACKSENQVPVGVQRTWVKVVEAGRYPDVRRSFQVTRCNHCSNPPCVRICPVSAMYQRDDGIVEFDSDACIGCKACMQACPYDAIYLDPVTKTAAKCHYCAHRVEVGLEPACVVVCPEHAIIAGDLDDPASEISRRLAGANATVRKPEQGTSPKLFYIQGNELALTPTAARVQKSMMFADVLDDPHLIGPVGGPAPEPRATRAHPRGTVRVPDRQGLPSGLPVQVGARMAEHMVQVGYTVRHEVPWHWPIAAYLVTKHVAGGVFGVLAAAALLGAWSEAAMVWGGLAGMGMLGVTLALLIYDLERPDRFFTLLLRPQWRSWVARAAWILTAFTAVAGGWWAVEVGAAMGLALPAESLRPMLAAATLPLAALTAIYTAFLFAQAEGRDLWQSPALPVQLAFQATALGGGALAAVGVFADLGPIAPWATAAFGGGLALAGLTTALAEAGISPPTELARRAATDLVWGRYRTQWWGALVIGHGVPLAAIASGVPLLAIPALWIACLGLFAWAYALVMAPQRIPNS